MARKPRIPPEIETEYKARRKQRAQRDLLMEQACWLETKNPIHVWRGLSIALRGDVDLPAWVLTEIKGIADAFYALSLTDKLDEKAKLAKLTERACLNKSDHPFEKFDALRSGLGLETIERVTIPRLRDPNLFGPGGLRYVGPDHKQESLKARARNHGMKPRTYESRVALARRVQARRAKIAKERAK